MHVTTLMNQKGGVGKTGVTVGIAGALIERGRRVLLVDLDPQGHLTESALQMSRIDLDEPSLGLALVGRYHGEVAALPVRRMALDNGGVLDVLPTSFQMFTVTRDLDKRPDRERQLGRLLEDLPRQDYDHVLIDPPPSLDILSDSALAASDGVLIPVQPDDTSVRALELLLSQIQELERALRLSPPLQMHGLVLSKFRPPLSGAERSTVEQLAEIPGLPLVAQAADAVVVKESWRTGVPLVQYAPKHKIADVYRSLADLLDDAAGQPSKRPDTERE